MAKNRFLVALCIPWLLAGCESFDYRYSPVQEHQFMSRVLATTSNPPRSDPLYLTAEAKAELNARIHRGWGERRKLRELRDFLFSKDEMHLRYEADTTKTAMQVWQTRSGNCLSLTNLFIASARYLGMDSHYETVEVKPSWDRRGNLMVRYEHIVATGQLLDGVQYSVDFMPDFVVGDRRARVISDRKALALYYNNLGAESLIAGKKKRAIGELAEAIQTDGSLSDAWNNMGAALNHSGEKTLAEFSFQRAVYLDMGNYSALANLAEFYQAEGREREARYFLDRINVYRKRNPWYRYFVANNLYEKGQYRKAISMLDGAVSLKRDEPDFYVALAKSYAKLGDDDQSRYYLTLANKYSKPQQDGNRD